MTLGIAFQLVDDALDYSADQEALGKTVGDDFREGKITLPVLLAFARGTDEERAFWRRTLEDRDQSDSDLATPQALIAPPRRAGRHHRARAAPTATRRSRRWPASRTGRNAARWRMWWRSASSGRGSAAEGASPPPDLPPPRA